MERRGFARPGYGGAFSPICWKKESIWVKGNHGQNETILRCRDKGLCSYKDSDGVEHPVSYFSKKLNCHQKWYSTIEKETLILVMALEHFEVYISSSNVSVIIYTDHNPLVFLHRMRIKNRRLMSWSLRVQG